jgi:cell division septation protein DedD
LSPEPAASPAAPELPLTTALYRALIGPVHTDYYLSLFARFDAAGRSAISWHWPAFFATFAWLVFRGMWAHALAFFGFSVAVALTLFGVLPLVTPVSQEWLWSLAALFLAVECVLPALWANAVYYRHCNRLVTQTLQSAPDMKETTERLAAMAGTRRRAIVLGVLNALVWIAVVALGAWLALAGPGHSAAPPSRSLSAPLTVASAPLPVASTVLPAAPASAATLVAAPASAPAPAASAASAPAAASASQPVTAASAPSPLASAPARVASAPAPMASAVAAPARVGPSVTAAASAPAPALASTSAASAPAPVKALAVTPAPKPAASKPAPAKVRKPPAKPKEAASAAKASASRGRFMVAVGQFALEQNADRAYARLEAAGLPVHSNTTETEAGPLLLIRVGPYRTLEQARQAAAQVRKLDLPAVVMRR